MKKKLQNIKDFYSTIMLKDFSKKEKFIAIFSFSLDLIIRIINFCIVDIFIKIIIIFLELLLLICKKIKISYPQKFFPKKIFLKAVKINQKKN
jgi:hypothetical protein